jgi:hypothetical protein
MTSIWLRPEPSQEQALQSLIRSVAAEQGTFPFAPHLTVCGAPGDPATLDAVTAYIKECGLLPLRVAKTAVTGALITPFRAVFIEVENTPELRQFRERLRDILGAPPLIPPHISLLYTLDGATQAQRLDLDAGQLAVIAARCAAAIPDTHFLLGRPVAHSSGGSGNADLRSWQIMREL